jgi:hypothetical protein
MENTIKKNTRYRIRGNSEYFKGKYGTSNPEILIEDDDYTVFGGSWAFQQGNPACLLYAMRSVKDQLPRDIIEHNTVFYGKVGHLGELVHKIELEEIHGKDSQNTDG